MGIIKENRIGIPKNPKDKKIIFVLPQGICFQWKMRDSRKVSAASWIDKKPNMLISNHARPIMWEGVKVTIPRCIDRVHVHILTFPFT